LAGVNLSSHLHIPHRKGKKKMKITNPISALTEKILAYPLESTIAATVANIACMCATYSLSLTIPSWESHLLNWVFSVITILSLIALCYFAWTGGKEAKRESGYHPSPEIYNIMVNLVIFLVCLDIIILSLIGLWLIWYFTK
jgi:hypothetical protein